VLKEKARTLEEKLVEARFNQTPKDLNRKNGRSKRSSLGRRDRSFKEENNY